MPREGDHCAKASRFARHEADAKRSMHHHNKDDAPALRNIDPSDAVGIAPDLSLETAFSAAVILSFQSSSRSVGR